MPTVDPPQPPLSQTARTKRLSMDPQLPLGIALQASLAGVMAYAHQWTSHGAEEPVRAIHAYRKSLRRSRAVVKLLRKLLRDEAYEGLSQDLRAAVHETSPIRDVDVLLGLTTSYPSTPETAPVLDSLAAILVECQARFRNSGRIEQVLQQGAAQIEKIHARLGGLLPSVVGVDDLRAALRDSHRRARRAYRRARKGQKPEHVHDWRKRVKELRYQLEMLQEITGGTEQQGTLSALAEELGGVTDLNVLHEHIDAQRERLPGPELLIAELQRAIAERVGDLVHKAAPLLEIKPRLFVEGILCPTLTTTESGRLQRPPADLIS